MGGGSILSLVPVWPTDVPRLGSLLTQIVHTSGMYVGIFLPLTSWSIFMLLHFKLFKVLKFHILTFSLSVCVSYSNVDSAFCLAFVGISSTPYFSY